MAENQRAASLTGSAPVPLAAEKRYALALGPAAVVAVGVGQKGAVSAMGGLDVGDVRIAQQLFASQSGSTRIKGSSRECRISVGTAM